MDNTVQQKVETLLKECQQKKTTLKNKIDTCVKNEDFEGAFKADTALRSIIVFISSLEHCLA